MGLFVNVNEATLSEMDYDSFIECHEENMLEAGTNIVIEAEQNWNAIMKAVGIEEVKAYAEGTEAITEAGRIGGMLEKAKQFFMNLWKKVVGMFKKLLSIFDQQVSKDKDFVKKYRPEVIKKMGVTDWNKDMSIDKYPFPSLGTWTSTAHGHLRTKASANHVDIEAKNVDGIDLAKARELDKISFKDEIADTTRSWALGENSTESESDFRKALKEKIYGDKDNKEVTKDLVLDAFKNIESSEGSKRSLKNTFKTMDDTLKATIKNLERAINAGVKTKDASGADKSDEGVKQATEVYSAIGLTLTIVKSCHTTLTSVYSMECQAIKDHNRQARAIVGKVYRRPVKEAGFEHFEESAYGNAFDSVVLV